MEDDDVPIIAFFGTKGGVGKTTISSRFAEYVTYGPGNPNVLMLDFDVQQRGMTINFTSGLGFSSNTIHEYMTEKLEIFDEAIDVTHKKNRQIGGRLYLIPPHKQILNLYILILQR